MLISSFIIHLNDFSFLWYMFFWVYWFVFFFFFVCVVNPHLLYCFDFFVRVWSMCKDWFNLRDVQGFNANEEVCCINDWYLFDGIWYAFFYDEMSIPCRALDCFFSPFRSDRVSVCRIFYVLCSFLNSWRWQTKR